MSDKLLDIIDTSDTPNILGDPPKDPMAEMSIVEINALIAGVEELAIDEMCLCHYNVKKAKRRKEYVIDNMGRTSILGVNGEGDDVYMSWTDAHSMVCKELNQAEYELELGRKNSIYTPKLKALKQRRIELIKSKI